MADLTGVDRVTLTDTLGNVAGEIIELKGNGHASTGPMSVVLKSLIPGRGTIQWVQPNKDAAGRFEGAVGVVTIVDGEPHVSHRARYYAAPFYKSIYDANGKDVGRWYIGEFREKAPADATYPEPHDGFIMFGNTAIKLGADGIAQIYNKLQAVDDGGVPMVELGQTGLLLRANGDLQQVSVGAPDSGGAGKRALVIDN